VGYWNDLADIARRWSLDREFQPQMSPDNRESIYQRWQEAVKRSLGWAK